MPATKKKTKKEFPTFQVIFLLTLLIVIGVAGSFLTPRSGADNSANGFEEAFEIPEGYSEEDARVLADLKKIFAAPEGIVPAMALVTDAELVKEQQPEFFARAKAGDRVILYPGITILFDPVAKKILNAGQVNLMANAEEPLELVTFMVLNGSGKAGVAAAYAEKVKTTFTNVEVGVGNAPEQIEETIVIDLEGQNPEIETIAEKLGAVVGTEVPDGIEIDPHYMVLVIVGTNYDPNESL